MKLKIIMQLFFFFILLGCSQNKQEIADDIIFKINEYQNVHSQLPTSLKTIGYKMDESGPVYYEIKNEKEYIIWYGTTLGESKVYYSKEKKWKNQ